MALVRSRRSKGGVFCRKEFLKHIVGEKSAARREADRFILENNKTGIRKSSDDFERRVN